jgi:sulfide:quinone oxidoreductase
MGLRALAGDRVKLTLVAPHDEFVYRPLVVEEGFAAGRMRRVPLSRAADDAGAAFLAATIGAVDPERVRRGLLGNVARMEMTPEACRRAHHSGL